MRNLQARAATTGGASLFVLPTDLNRRRGKERRRHKRIPKSIGILIEPLDEDQLTTDRAFFAITRDISKGGLGFLSSEYADYEMVLISREDDPTRAVVCRVCDCCLVHKNEFEEVYLTCVEFLYERCG